MQYKRAWQGTIIVVVDDDKQNKNSSIMKTKEEILESYLGKRISVLNDRPTTYKLILQAMQAYHDQFSESPSGETLEAGQGAIAFVEWCSKNYYCYDANGNWFRDIVNWKAEKRVTTQQLYNDFLQQTGKPSIDTLRVQQNADYQKLKAENERLKGLIENLWYQTIKTEYDPYYSNDHEEMKRRFLRFKADNNL